MTNSTDLGKTVAILHRHHIDVQARIEQRQYPLEGYIDILKAMLEAFHDAGYNDAAIAFAHSGHPLTHESGAYVRLHPVVVHDGAVYDPLLRSREPLAVATYLQRAFPDDHAQTRLWGETTKGDYRTDLLKEAA
jgi:hypothetical protein